MPRLVKAVAAKTTQFKLYAPAARSVAVAGSFNNWNAQGLIAKKDSKGNWSAKVSLKPGQYEYKFVVDGNWMNDPACSATVGNSFGSANSVLQVR